MADDDAPIPKWVRDERTFRIVSSAGGVALGALIAIVAAATPSIPQAVVDVIFVPAILVAVIVAVPVIGFRMLFVREQALADVPMTRWVVAFALSALPIGIATLLLGALTTLALVFELNSASDLAAGIVALVGTWVLLSLIVKIVLNAPTVAAPVGQTLTSTFHPKRT